MKRILIFFIAVLTCCISLGQTEYFSILTCAPGNDVYATFGHTAIRYVNTKSHTDIVYNYGIFSYTENFVYNFAKGNTYYELGVHRFESFKHAYERYERPIFEQKLNLSVEQVQNMKLYLENNYKPENREYLYNFFYDNCSSRPRDIIDSIIGENLNWNYDKSYSIPNGFWYKKNISNLFLKSNDCTWRDALNFYTNDHSWLQFGIVMTMGTPTDKIMSRYQSMFLPDFLLFNIQNATIKTNNAVTPLTNTTTLITPNNFKQPEYDFYSTPIFVIWMIALFFIVISLVGFLKKKHFFWIDSVLYLLLGILGFVVCYISFFSIHPATFPNLNVIWANPLHIIFAIVWLIPKLRKQLYIYNKAYTFVFILFIISIPLIPQFIHPAYIPLLLIYVSRGFYRLN